MIFSGTMKFCQTHRHTTAKAATWPTLQPVTSHLCPHQESSTQNRLGNKCMWTPYTSATHPCTAASQLCRSYNITKKFWLAAVSSLSLKQVFLTLHFYVHICRWSPHYISVHVSILGIENRLRNWNPQKKKHKQTTKLQTAYEQQQLHEFLLKHPLQ